MAFFLRYSSCGDTYRCSGSASRSGAHGRLRSPHGLGGRSFRQAVSLDRCLCGVQLPGALSTDRRERVSRAGPGAGRSGPPRPRSTPGGRSADGLDQRARRGRGRTPPHPRGIEDRQGPTRTAAGRASGSPPRMGPGRPVLPLPDQVDARFTSREPGDGQRRLFPLGRGAGRHRPRSVHGPRGPLRLEDEHRSGPWCRPWGTTIRWTG